MLDTVAENAARLCEADDAQILRSTAMCFDAQRPLVHIKLRRADHCREKPPLAALSSIGKQFMSMTFVRQMTKGLDTSDLDLARVVRFLLCHWFVRVFPLGLFLFADFKFARLQTIRSRS